MEKHKNIKYTNIIIICKYILYKFMGTSWKS